MIRRLIRVVRPEVALAAFVLLLPCAGFMAGCGSGGGGSDPAPSPSPTPTTSPVPTPTPSVAPTPTPTPLPVAVTVSPAPTVTVPVGASLTFQALVSNAPDGNNTVQWSVTEGDAGGVITSAGVYTAPNAPGTFHVVATSVSDPTKSATVEVSVVAGGATVGGGFPGSGGGTIVIN